MPMYLGQRIHALVNGFGRSSEEQQTRHLYGEVEREFGQHGLLFDDARDRLAANLARDVLVKFDLPADHSQFPYIAGLLQVLSKANNYSSCPIPSGANPQPQPNTGTSAKIWNASGIWCRTLSKAVNCCVCFCAMFSSQYILPALHYWWSQIQTVLPSPRT